MGSLWARMARWREVRDEGEGELGRGADGGEGKEESKKGLNGSEGSEDEGGVGCARERVVRLLRGI